jgi:hypothetical protein
MENNGKDGFQTRLYHYTTNNIYAMALTMTIVGGTFHLSGNPLLVSITVDTIPAGATNYKILCKVTSTDGVLIGGPFIDAKAPDDEGEALFDVSGYCDQPVEKVLEYPLIGGLNPYGNDTLDLTFTPGESYIDTDGDLVETWGSASAGNYVVKGGVGPRKLGEYIDDNSSFYADYVTGAKWLTHFPAIQTVAPMQPVKLWLLAAAAGAKTLHIKVYYDDGSTYEWTHSYTLYQDILHEINCLPYHADPTNMMPVKPVNIKMLYYEVWFASLTAKMTFYVDHTYHEQCNFLFALNSLGGIDCVWLSGEVKKGFKTESVQAVRPFPIDGTAKYRTVIVASRTGQRTWKINTGWKPKTEMEALKDLLLSKQVWLLEDFTGNATGTVHPVTIETSSADLYDSQEDLYALELDIVEAHNSQYL